MPTCCAAPRPGAVLIDAANEATGCSSCIGDTPLDWIVTTHRHWDHWQALPEVRPATSAVIIAHPDDAAELPVTATARSAAATGCRSARPSISVIHLRGHTPGSIALCYDADGALADSPHLFTGDSLFPGGPGNTERDPKRFGQLMDDLEERVFGALPDATWVYPGHGKDTTLGAERPHMAEWRARGW